MVEVGELRPIKNKTTFFPKGKREILVPYQIRKEHKEFLRGLSHLGGWGKKNRIIIY